MENYKNSEANTRKNAINEAGFYQYFENGMLYCPNDQSSCSQTAIRIFRKAVWEAFDLNEASFPKDLELTYSVSDGEESRVLMLDFSMDCYFLPQEAGLEKVRLHEDKDYLVSNYGEHGCIKYIKCSGTAFIESKSTTGLNTILDSILSLYEENGSIIDLVSPTDEDDWEEEEFFNENF
jgi:hypothetical protein